MIQLDICKEMARDYTRVSLKCNMQFAVSVCMGCRPFSNCCSNSMGKFSHCTFGPKYYWFGCDNGWHCSVASFLFDNALVEDTMAKLKYVQSFIVITISGVMFFFPSILRIKVMCGV